MYTRTEDMLKPLSLPSGTWSIATIEVALRLVHRLTIDCLALTIHMTRKGTMPFALYCACK